MSELLNNLSNVIPALIVLAIVFAFIGWSLRGLSSKPEAAAKPGKPAPPEKNRDERVKNLEAALEKEKAARKAAKAELDGLKSSTVIKESHDNALAELEAAHQSLATESKRTAALETELKRAQEAVKAHNTRINEAGKTQKERDFTLQNELSKARAELAALRDRPNDTAALQNEIERLRESVATTTRFSGELRKREAASAEELEKVKIQLADLSRGKPMTVAKKLGPVGESERVAAAKAEVLRLVEKNKRDGIARSAPAVTGEAPLPIMPAPAVVAPEPTPAPAAFTEAVPTGSPAAGPHSPAPAEAMKELPSQVSFAEAETKRVPLPASPDQEVMRAEEIPSAGTQVLSADEIPSIDEEKVPEIAAEPAADVAAEEPPAPELGAAPESEPVKEPENPTA